ncbi:glycosyltransferase [Corynebacterium afermentans]|uniref:glycosyltransferase n=1 Tax=Corynebacterium afermentans TaxID=38286 RepID=UPI002572F23D|nr:glycosyltransferase [Corynebacterium afermentans]MCG7274568.1 glycosyltransferase [Corynebacterium afermentans]
MSASNPTLSVIVPTYAGVDRLPCLLESFERQTLQRDSWEAVFVSNGHDDGTVDLLNRWREGTSVQSRVFRSSESGAGLARNLGLAVARGDVITFVDDDDWIEDRYLETGLHHASDGCIALLPIKEETSGVLTDNNSLNARRNLISGATLPVHDVAWALGFNACKFVPSKLLRNLRYADDLKSGEDVVFFAHLLSIPGLRVTVPGNDRESAYVRTVRPDSVSRQQDSFDFCVAQRLDVIAKLKNIPLPAESKSALDSLVSSQFNFVVNRLQNHPEELRNAARHSLVVGAGGLNWRLAHNQDAQRLIFSYCFPPFADPAANVAAKRIVERQEVVDVVSADMSSVRTIDSSVNRLVDPWVSVHQTVRGVASFASWPAIASFGKKAARAAKRNYASVYSRALWSGSHVAGALYKLKNPSVYWEAEFSDPMRWNASGDPRAGGKASGLTARKLRRAVELAGWGSELETCRDDHFAFTELVALSLADEVIFTNRNQKDIVLSSYSQDFKDMVIAKSSVMPQPVPPPEAYEAVRVDLQLDPQKVNIAYFGNFYANRGLGDYLNALDLLPTERADAVALHVFSDVANGGKLEDLQRSQHIVAHQAVDYLDFLAACKLFDALLVVDTITENTPYPVNPFLPSKFSDYLGSGTPVWAMVEPGSPLSEVRMTYASDLGNSRQASEQLIQIIGARG